LCIRYVSTNANSRYFFDECTAERQALRKKCAGCIYPLFDLKPFCLTIGVVDSRIIFSSISVAARPHAMHSAAMLCLLVAAAQAGELASTASTAQPAGAQRPGRLPAFLVVSPVS